MPMYALNSGNCSVVKITIGMHTRGFLIEIAAATSIVKLYHITVPYKLRDRTDHEHTLVMETVDRFTLKSKGSFSLLSWGTRNVNIGYMCSIINGDGLLGLPFLGKHQSRVLLVKNKLILDRVIELILTPERICLVSHEMDTK